MSLTRLTLMAVFVQTVVWFAVACLESVGLLGLERWLVEAGYAIYWPAIWVAQQILPREWQVLGNIPLGFCVVGFAIVVYSAMFALMFAAVRSIVQRRRLTSSSS